MRSTTVFVDEFTVTSITCFRKAFTNFGNQFSEKFLLLIIK